MKLLDIRKSKQKNKNYSADIILDGKLYKNVNFGDIRFNQYRDSTPLKLYSHLDHNDKNRKRLYLLRHAKDKGPAGILSKLYLWN